MTKVLYLDCFSGAAGDMLLGAFLDVGASEEDVRENLRTLGLEERLHLRRVTKNGLSALKVQVNVDGGTARDHAAIDAYLVDSSLPGPTKDLARQVFRRLAEAEGRVHGVPPERVHFHEVGATDALVDIVGSCAAFISLAPDVVVTSPLPTGRGFVDSAHGTLPIPAPAVLELLKGAPLFERGERELVTPTGAALLATFTDRWGPMPALTIETTGYGAGTSDDEIPNVVRAVVGEALEVETDEAALLIETNIDDMAPELIPHALESLIEAGAHDAWVESIAMKKERSGFKISVLCDPLDLDRISDVMFRETTTFGFRVRGVGKRVLERSWIEVEVAGHPVRVKVGGRGGKVITVAPEFDDARSVARATGMALRNVYALALEAANEQLRV